MCLPRVVLPVVLFSAFVALVLLVVPPMSPVDSRAQDGGEQHNGHSEGDETRKGETWALDTVRPRRLAVFVAPCLAAEERQWGRGLAVLAGHLFVVEAGADEQLAWVESRGHCGGWAWMDVLCSVWVAYRICGEAAQRSCCGSCGLARREKQQYCAGLVCSATRVAVQKEGGITMHLGRWRRRVKRVTVLGRDGVAGLWVTLSVGREMAAGWEGERPTLFPSAARPPSQASANRASAALQGTCTEFEFWRQAMAEKIG